MNERWPSERYAETREVFIDASFKTTQDFLDLWSVFPNELLSDFDDVVIWVAEQNGGLAELDQKIASIADSANLQASDSCELLMTLACAAALARSPRLSTWIKVNAFKYNSWQLEHWLGNAMMAYSTVHSSASDAYVRLAQQVFTSLENFSLSSKSERINEERAGAWVSWNEGRGKLEEIWWNLRGWHGFMSYKEEMPLFEVFYKLEPAGFISLFSKSSNPYLVSALLFVAGIGSFSPRFLEWKRIIAEAPIAFEDTGEWNGSVLMPLLLVEARSQLVLVMQSPRTLDLAIDELDKLKQEIIGAAELIVTALAAREDAASIFARWTPWLMRQILGAAAKEIEDLKSGVFADNILIEIIGNNLKDISLPQKSPDDAPPWEPWCYRCVLSSFAYSGQIKVPDWASFLDEWNISAEDWIGTKGYTLRARADLINMLGKETPGNAANLLGYPITQSACPGAVWIGLWDNALILRDIVEFGDADAAEDEYSSRMDASRLLLFLFRIGLAIFDQCSARSDDNNSSEARSLAVLFKALNCAIWEMREIDNTLNHDEWFSVVQHLAVRRMIWESPSNNQYTSGSFQVFNAGDTPSLSEILADAKGNVIELVSILQSLLLNSPNASRLKHHVNWVSADFFEVVRSVRNLNQYHPRKYPIDEVQLRKLEACLS